jgi:RNA polymerase sigma-70 factor, ECF subfamily
VDDRERWVSAWWPRVYRMALALTGHEADAEDLAQDTLMAGLAARERFRRESSESTWLYAILRNKYRSRQRRPSDVERPPAVPRERAVDEALALLAKLPEPQRLAAALFYVEGLSVRDVAAALGIPAATVRWRLWRARRALRRTLGDAPPVCKELL